MEKQQTEKYQNLKFASSWFVEKVASQIEASVKPLCDEIKVVGSIRRKKPFVGDCESVVLAADGNWARIVHALRKPKVTRAGCRKLANETKKVVLAI